MSHSSQKFIKFSKGEINQYLNERTDIELLDNSASYIKNYIPTLFGGIKTRFGTEEISKFNFTKNVYSVSNQTFTKTLILNNINKYSDYTNIKGINFTSYINTTIEPVFEEEQVVKETIDYYCFTDGTNNYYTKSIEDNNNIEVYDVNFNLLGNGDLTSLVLTYNSNTYSRDDTQDEQQIIYETLNKLTTINITQKGTRILNPHIEFETDREEITTATFTCNLDSNGELESITITGDFYYKDTYTLNLVYDNITTTNINVYVLNNGVYDLLNTYEFNLSSELNINNLILSSYDNITNIKIETDDRFYLKIDNIDLYQYVYSVSDIKALPFIYNKNDYCLIVLTIDRIFIITNDDITQSIDLTEELSFVDIQNVKYSQLENVIVFTETSKQPRKLTRNTDTNTWTFEFLTLTNIPKHCFNKETTTTKTVGITPSALSGSITITADSDVFDSSYVGQFIDGNMGRVRITSYVNSKKVYGYTIIPFLTTDKITNWSYISGYEDVWSDSKGYPNCCLFYQERLFFGGSKSRPLTLWGSRINDYGNFGNTSNSNNEAIDIDISTTENSEIVNLYGNRGIQIFTGGAEFIAPETNLTPNNFSVIQTSNIGSKKDTEPKNIAGRTIFCESKGRNIYNYVYDYEQASYQSQAISLLNNNIINNPINIETCFNPNWTDGNFIFVVNEDGTITLDNFIQEQNINSWTRMISNNIIYNDCITILDNIYFINTMNNQVFISKLNKDLRTDNTIKKEIEEATIIITGLEIFNNLEVRVYHINNDDNKSVVNYGSYTVNNGSIRLDSLVSGTIYIGIDIDCKLISNNIMINNKSYSIKKRISTATITTSNKNEVMNFNNKSASVIILNNEYDIDNNTANQDKIYKILSCSNYQLENKFTIQSTFNIVDLKSIMLNLNWGE